MTTSETTDHDDVRVLYVMGCGRSGSTLLTLLLGAHAQAFGGGEIQHFVRQGLVQGLPCSCGVPVPDCPVWSRILDAWIARCPDWDRARYLELTSRIEAFPSIPRIVRAQPDTDPDATQLIAWTRALVLAIASVTGKAVIVDASKSLARAALLSRALPGQVDVVHLIRDGRGVVSSFGRPIARDVAGGVQRDMPGRAAWRSSVEWSLKNLTYSTVGQLAVRSQVSRYEDLLADPTGELNRIGGLVGLDYSELGAALDGELDLSDTHVVAGNRLRMSKRLTLRRDERWRQALGRRERGVYWSVAWPAALYFGYL